MLFKPHHIEQIQIGLKTVTRRRWKKPHAKRDGTYSVQIRMFQRRDECPMIRAEDVYLQPLGEMTESDARKEGGWYDDDGYFHQYTLETFKKAWKKINGVDLDPNEVVYVVEFECISEKGDLVAV